MNVARIPWALALALLVAGVASGCLGPKVNWQQRVGAFTFDQAVLEMGPPDKQAKLTDGTVVAEWITLRGGSHPSGAHAGLAYSRGGWIPLYHESDTPECSLRLIFDPEGRLKEWKEVVR